MLRIGETQWFQFSSNLSIFIFGKKKFIRLYLKSHGERAKVSAAHTSSLGGREVFCTCVGQGDVGNEPLKSSKHLSLFTRRCVCWVLDVGKPEAKVASDAELWCVDNVN